MAPATHTQPLRVPMKATPRDWFLLSSLGLIWGCAFMATTVATVDFETFTLAALRLAIGTVALLTILAWRREGQ